MKTSPTSPGSASVPSARTILNCPAIDLPTEPRCASHSTPLMIVAACASVPAYSSQIASATEPVDPLFLQPRRARRARDATRPSTTTRRSGRARRRGSFEMRAIIVGTTYIESGWYWSMSASVLLGVELAAEHDVVAREQRGHRPHERTVVVQRTGHQVRAVELHHQQRVRVGIDRAGLVRSRISFGRPVAAARRHRLPRVRRPRRAAAPSSSAASGSSRGRHVRPGWSAGRRRRSPRARRAR